MVNTRERGRVNMSPLNAKPEDFRVASNNIRFVVTEIIVRTRAAYLNRRTIYRNRTY